MKSLFEIGFSLLYFSLTVIYSKKVLARIEQAFTQVSGHNHHIIGKLGEAKNSVETITQSTSSAAGSMEETVASLEELNSMVKLNSEHAKQAAALAQNSRDTAENGEKEITLLIQSMKDITDSSKKIQEITYLIDDISFQTNLLALNAAVEAARAGEQGRGFAVVADAVRNLAQKSAVAAKDIGSLINETTAKVDKGFSQANNSGEVLKKILTSVKMVSDLNNEISLASQEQTLGLNQIAQAMNIIDQSLQTNSSTMVTLKEQFQGIESLSSEPPSKSILPTATHLVGKNLSSAESTLSHSIAEKTQFNAKTIPAEKQKKSESKDAVTKIDSQRTTSPSNNTSVSEKPNQSKNSNPQKKAKAKTSQKQDSGNSAKIVAIKSKAEELIPFDDDIDRTRLAKAEDF
ncbi:MAG: hypothetical protein HUU56_12495 [Bdellovibrionaceae bacterium]|nr:hypothetical protein [Pseudobdellovibrionaceae bacterium]